MSGYKFVIPTTFTDNDLPFMLPSAGVDGYNYRYSATPLGPKYSLIDGDPVPTWASFGSETTALASATVSGAGAPTYRANSGSPYVEFDGTDDGMGIANFVTDSVATVVVVMRHINSGGSLPVVSGSGWNLSRGGVLTLSGNTGGIPTVFPSANVWHVVAAVINGNSSFVKVDATVSAQVPANVATSTTHLQVGKEGSFHCRVDIAEIITYPTALTSGDIATIRTAMQDAHPGLSL